MEEEDYATREANDDDAADFSQLTDPHLVGFVIVNIVGLRYYSGTINGREMVGLVREPLNPHDPNAIKVLNTRCAQVGHIERTAAAALAPLIDSHLITVEGIVPKPPRNSSPYRLPCQVHIFALPDAIPTVCGAIVSAGLQLISDSDPEFPLSESAIVRERTSGSSSRSQSEKDEKQRVDEIFALVGKAAVNIAPVEPPKEVITSELLPHQKEGLGWLVHRENANELPPFWDEKGGAYLNVLTNYRTSERPEPLKGGILADDMGLGKTLMLLSLIATNRPPRCGDERVFKGGRSKSVRQAVGGSRKKRKVDDGIPLGGEASVPKTTLVVCPLSVSTTWITQLEEHTRPGGLKVYLYHGERTKEAAVLLTHDIVLTTYKTLASEFSSSDSPLLEIEWWRVILDEAHVIKNFAAQQTKAAIALQAQRRWVVTGTPIQNSSFDLFSLMAFLRFQPFSIMSYWQSLVQRPLNQGCKSGISRLQALMGTISLRRLKLMQNGSKSLVGLPGKTVETCFVELSDEERECYDQMEAEAKNTIHEYIESDTVFRNYSTVLYIILRLRQICNDMALCPSDIKSLLSYTSPQDASENPDLVRKLGSMVEDGDDFDCPVCLSPPVKTVITRCTHIFCQRCILKTLKTLKPCCPICRHSLSQSDLFSVGPLKPVNDDSAGISSNRPISSKVSALLKLLRASKKENPSTKSVVFSQFRKMLTLLEEPLRVAGFGVLRLDGSMTMRKRTEVVQEFQTASPCMPTVLLASLKAAGAGINLTAASTVYLVEPWWNPAVEEQAMDRVHRIGQQKEVRVVRLVVRESIEERMLELQERKKQLAGGVFGQKGVKEQRQVRMEELRAVMRL